MKTAYCLIVPVLMALSSQAQEPTEFFDRFTLRQSFQSTKEKAESAVVTFTQPKDSVSSWLLNAAVGFNFLADTRLIMTLEPFIEFHKNTLVAKKQDNWQTGLAFEWQVNQFKVGSKKVWSPIILWSEKYNNDRVEKNESIQGNIYVTLLRKKRGLAFKDFYLPNHPVNVGNAFQLEYTPYVGLEHENRLTAKTEAALGNIYRYYGRVTSSVTLLTKNEKFRGRVEATVDYQYRKDFAKSVLDIPATTHEYFTAGVNYTFFKSADDKKSAKIGFDYVNGEDPTKNFKKQSYYALSLKVKI